MSTIYKLPSDKNVSLISEYIQKAVRETLFTVHSPHSTLLLPLFYIPNRGQLKILCLRKSVILDSSIEEGRWEGQINIHVFTERIITQLVHTPTSHVKRLPQNSGPPYKQL